MEIFVAIPDHAGAAETTADLARCRLHQGLYDEALTAIEASIERINEHALRGHQVTTPRAVLAEVYLAGTEQGRRPHDLKSLRRVCAAAQRQGKVFREGLPTAMRLTGTREWLTGKRSAASESWAKSLAVAEFLGARYDIGLTYAEMGKRLGDLTYVERAAKVLTEVGAEFQLAATHRVLAELKGANHTIPAG